MSNQLTIIQSKTYALDLSLTQWKKWCLDKRYPPYIGDQIYQWIFTKFNTNPSTFTNISLKIRESLEEDFSWHLPHIDSHLQSIDSSEKFLLKTQDNLLFEMVLMPYENRSTLCISSQVGCKMGCTFCQTGRIGFKRDLSSGEILSQLVLAGQRGAKVTNVVFMGMGEPLDNYENVVQACRIMIDPKALALSSSRVTISTSGLVPEIRRLAKDLPVRLAISLHTADDEKRSAMMPINRTYDLVKLKEALLDYPAPKRYGITFEYVMIKGENDSLKDAKKLVHFIHGLKAKVNLIPINHFPGVEMEPSDTARIREFQLYLTERSIAAPVRYSRGQDISGGCGQLAAKRENELDMDPREVSRQRRHASRTANIVD